MITTLVLAAAAITAQPDVIQLDDNCRLIKKAAPAPAATVRKPKPFITQFLVKPKPHNKKKPILKADIPADYEMNCDETPPLMQRYVAPPAEVVPPLEMVPPVPFPSLFVVPGSPEVPEVPTDTPEGGYGPIFGPPATFPGPIVYTAPLPPIDEPPVWLLFGALLPLAYLKKKK